MLIFLSSFQMLSTKHDSVSVGVPVESVDDLTIWTERKPRPRHLHVWILSALLPPFELFNFPHLVHVLLLCLPLLSLNSLSWFKVRVTQVHQLYLHRYLQTKPVIVNLCWFDLAALRRPCLMFNRPALAGGRRKVEWVECWLTLCSDWSETTRLWISSSRALWDPSRPSGMGGDGPGSEPNTRLLETRH